MPQGSCYPMYASCTCSNILCLLRSEGFLSFRCEPLRICVCQKVERRQVPLFLTIFNALIFVLSTLLRGGVELV